MKKRNSDSLKAMLLTMAVIVLVKLINGLPWWLFVVPVMFLGVVLTARKWQVSGFMTGFIAGFIIWFGANWYFSVSRYDIILSRIGSMLFVPEIVVLLIAGITGGLLTGLALYTGRIAAAGKIKSLPF